VAAIGKRLAEGAIGELRLVRSSFSFPIEAGDRRLDVARGGGALWDVGCYGVSTARWFAGSEPQSIAAQARFGPTEVDLSLTALLQFPGDLLGVVDCSFEQPFRCTYELVGTAGAIVVPDAYLPPAEPRAQWIAADGAIREEWTFDGRNQYAAMVDAFARGVESGRLEPPAEDGLAQMQVLEAVLAAARGVGG
jgi:predicted dehydrogenase